MNSRNNRRRHSRRRTVAVLPALLVFFLPGLPIASAQYDDSKRFGIGLGAFVTERDSKTRLDGSVGSDGTPIDLESDLGLEKSGTVVRLDGFFRISESHRLDFSVFDLSRSSSKRVQTEIDFDDVIYPVDTVVSSEFDLNIYKLAYTWSFVQRDSGYLGVTGGVYVADIGTKLAAESIGARSGSGITAPLPVIGLRGEHAFNNKWSVRASAEFFALEYNDYSGGLVDWLVGVDYRVTERTSVGIGFNSVGFDVGVDKQRLNGDLDWRYSGAILSLRVDF